MLHCSLFLVLHMKLTHNIALLYRSRLQNLIKHFTNIPSKQMDEFLSIFSLELLSSKYHEIEYLGRKIVEKYYAIFLISNYNKLFLSADERYDVFVRERSSMMNRVPLLHVASHLGIKPESLSRLRAKQQPVRI